MPIKVGPVLVLGILLAACSRTPAPVAASSTSGAPTAAQPIQWQRWSTEAFAKAKREGKLVLVDVGIEGCTACRWMYEGTYKNPEVAQRINEHFVAIAVDADQEPDVGERYEAWGWPATIFLLPDGTQVKAIEGSERPGKFIPTLDSLVADQRAGKLVADASVTHGERSAPRSGDKNWKALCQLGAHTLEQRGHAEGWGRGPEGPHFVMSEPIAWADYRARDYGDPRDVARASAVAAGMRKIIDPVWGGIYVAAHGAAWSDPIVEKRIVQEGYALETFGSEYARTGDKSWLAAAEKVHEYNARWMTAADGTFYTTQQDDAPKLPESMDSAAYYKLPEVERLKYGVPPIDHAVYTDQNAIMIGAYLKLYAATGDPKWAAVARRTGDTLLATRLRPEGWILQVSKSDVSDKDERKRTALTDGRMYLKAQAQMGRALLALHAATGETKWLDAARSIAKATRARLEDPKDGGFFTTEARETDALAPRRKAFYDNVIAARFLLDLAEITKDAALEKSAERALAAMAGSAGEEDTTSVSHFSFALERVVNGPLSITITGDAVDPRAKALRDAAVRLREPRALIHVDVAKTYPQGRTAAYVCTRDQCSSPIADAAALGAVVQRMAAIRPGEGCRAAP